MPLLNLFGELETLLADELYPHRYVIAPLLALVAAGLIYLAYRRGALRLLREHRLATIGIGAPLLVVAVVAGNYLLSPLWERSRLDEASPIVAAADDPSTPIAEATSPPAAFEAMVVQTGMFEGADDFHFGRGAAQLIQTGPATYVLRFENFSVRNGPDLFVYLSEHPQGEDVAEHLNLGRLKATDGAFNYEIPASIDVSRVKSAIVWCRQFSVLFAHAELMPG